jgi:hypothetical protein
MTATTGQWGQESWEQCCWARHLKQEKETGQDSRAGQQRWGSLDRIERDRTDGTGQTGQDRRDRTDGTGHLAQKNLERTAETGRAGQVGLTGHPGQDGKDIKMFGKRLFPFLQKFLIFAKIFA